MKQQRTIFILSLSIVFACASLGAFIIVFRMVEHKNQHTSAVEIALAEKIADEEHSAVLSKKIADLQASKNIIDSYFANPSNIDTFVGTLENLGSQFGSLITVNNVEVAPDKQNIMTTEFTVHGSFQEVMRTVSALENAPYQIHIKELNINRELGKESGDATQKSTGISWQAGITIEVITS